MLAVLRIGLPDLALKKPVINHSCATNSRGIAECCLEFVQKVLDYLHWYSLYQIVFHLRA